MIDKGKFTRTYVSLLPGISRQQTIFLSNLRFFVQWFNGSMVPWFHGSMVICDCSAVQSAVCLSKCLAAAPVFLLGATHSRPQSPSFLGHVVRKQGALGCLPFDRKFRKFRMEGKW